MTDRGERGSRERQRNEEDRRARKNALAVSPTQQPKVTSPPGCVLRDPGHRHSRCIGGPGRVSLHSFQARQSVRVANSGAASRSAAGARPEGLRRSGDRSGATTPASGSTGRSVGAPTWSASSPTATRSSAWSAPCSPSNTTNGPKAAATWASTSSAAAASDPFPEPTPPTPRSERSGARRLIHHEDHAPAVTHHASGLDRSSGWRPPMFTSGGATEHDIPTTPSLPTDQMGHDLETDSRRSDLAGTALSRRRLGHPVLFQQRPRAAPLEWE